MDSLLTELLSTLYQQIIFFRKLLEEKRKIYILYFNICSHFCKEYPITHQFECRCIFQDGILIENMHDVPYIKQKDISPEVITMMTRICTEVRKVTPQNIACGVQV